jgi:hypothetical protein
MRLFTPMSDAEADQAERGALYGEFIWADKPQPEAAAPGMIWVTIDMPDIRMHRFEIRADSARGYREFLLPSRVTNLHQAQRVDPQS